MSARTLGGASAGVRILSVSLEGRLLIIEADVPSGSVSHIQMRTAWEIAEAKGVHVEHLANERTDLSHQGSQPDLCLPAGLQGRYAPPIEFGESFNGRARQNTQATVVADLVAGDHRAVGHLGTGLQDCFSRRGRLFQSGALYRGPRPFDGFRWLGGLEAYSRQTPHRDWKGSVLGFSDRHSGRRGQSGFLPGTGQGWEGIRCRSCNGIVPHDHGAAGPGLFEGAAGARAMGWFGLGVCGHLSTNCLIKIGEERKMHFWLGFAILALVLWGATGITQKLSTNRISS